jgi:hypothetical protein
MTIDLIDAARVRTRRLLLMIVVAVLLLAPSIFFAIAYAVTAHDSNPALSVPLTASPGPGSTAPGEVRLPADTTWTTVAGVPLPASPSTGPTHMEQGLASGFMPTARGAVVAALHLLVRTTPQVGPDIFEPTIQAQVVGEAQALHRAVIDEYTAGAAALGVAYGQPLGELPATLVGVRVEDAQPERVQVAVLTAAVDSTGTRRYAATTVTMLWSDDDWRLSAPPGGSWDAVVRLVDPINVADYPPLRVG